MCSCGVGMTASCCASVSPHLAHDTQHNKDCLTAALTLKVEPWFSAEEKAYDRAEESSG